MGLAVVGKGVGAADVVGEIDGALDEVGASEVDGADDVVGASVARAAKVSFMPSAPANLG